MEKFLTLGKFLRIAIPRENRASREQTCSELHNFSACGKTVNGMCKGRTPFAHFSLAHKSPIGDNPARSKSGGKRANNTRWRRALASGATSTSRAQGKPKANGKIA